MKTVCTASEQPSSMVNRSRVQSQEEPSFFSCSTMRPPYWRFQSQARSKNFSLPMSSLVAPSFRMASTIFASVAMEA